MKWKIWPNARPNITPAAPASAEPMKNVDGDHPVDVDSHHRGGLAVERRRAHRLPELRARDEQRERDHQRDRRRRRRGSRIFQMKTSPMWMPPNADEVERVVVAVARAEQDQRAVLEQERDAERADQRRDARRVAQAPVGEALDHDAERRRTPSIETANISAIRSQTLMLGLSAPPSSGQDAEAR